jgi:hypothetical protein
MDIKKIEEIGTFKFFGPRIDSKVKMKNKLNLLSLWG